MYERILVPTDGSERFERVAEEAVELAALCGATIHAVYVVDAQAVDYSTTPKARRETEDSLRATGEAAIEDVADLAADRDVAVEGAILEGVPHEEILDYAEEIDADLIVMGTHGRTGLNRVLLGSVAERVIRLSDRPVVAVKLGTGERTIAGEGDAVDAAVETLSAEGYEFDDLREDPYREASTWVVPVETESGERVNVHVDATTGECRLANLD